MYSLNSYHNVVITPSESLTFFQNYTPLHAAAAMGQERIIERLLKFGASVSIIVTQ